MSMEVLIALVLAAAWLAIAVVLLALCWVAKRGDSNPWPRVEVGRGCPACRKGEQRVSGDS